MDSVHGSGTSAGRGPWWTNHHGWPWSIMEFGVVAAPGHGCLPRGGEKEGGTGIQLCQIPRHGRRRGGGAPAVKLRLQRAMVWALWGLREGELEV
jgi:hypothetical protein